MTAAFLLVAFRAPFLGFVEEEDPFSGSSPGRSRPEFHFIFLSQLFPLLARDGRATSVGPLLRSASSWGWERPGRQQPWGRMKPGIEKRLSRVRKPGQSFCQSPVRASPHPAAFGARHISCPGAE